MENNKRRRRVELKRKEVKNMGRARAGEGEGEGRPMYRRWRLGKRILVEVKAAKLMKG